MKAFKRTLKLYKRFQSKRNKAGKIHQSQHDSDRDNDTADDLSDNTENSARTFKLNKRLQ